MADRPKLISLAAARADRQYLTLMELLESYCVQESDSAERVRALQRFFGGEVDIANLPESAVDEFLDWFAFSYRLESSGERIVEQFGEEHQRLTGETPLPGLYTSRLGLFSVEQQRGYRHELVDCLTGERLLLNMEGDLPAPKGTLFCGRLIEVGDQWRPGFALDSIPPEMMEPLQPLLRVELARLQLAYPEATWSDLFDQRWPLLRDMMALRYELEPVEISLPALPPAPAVDGSELPGGLLRGHGDFSAAGEGRPEGAPEVAFILQNHARDFGLAHEDTARLIRLWYDAAALLQPSIRRPESWAAGAAWAFHTLVDELPITQAEFADEFELSTSAVGTKGRQIASALGLITGDDRYADPLAPANRMRRLTELFGPQAMQTLFE